MPEELDTANKTDAALVIMARYPEAGKTKTRLARSIGDATVRELYQAFLTDLAQHFAVTQFTLCWAYTPVERDYQAFIGTLVPEHAGRMRYFPQQGRDFGERLHHAFRWTQEQGFAKTILIGSDSPHISRDVIEQAYRALEDADVVLGPADDGGYYLIAMRKAYDVFTGIPMSTPIVLRMTIESAQRQGLKIHLLEALFDVDELPELLRLAQLLQEKRTLAPNTADQLDKLKIRNEL
jgi:rSAM/selenodomain-associated transferase 1